MVISFFGHSDFIEENNSKELVLSTLNSLVKGKSVDIYLGGTEVLIDLRMLAVKS